MSASKKQEIVVENKKKKEQELENTIQHLEAVIANNPADEKVKHVLARLYAQTGSKEKAYQLFQESLALKKDPLVLNDLGAVLLTDKQWDLAIPLLQNAIQLDPTFVDAYLNLAMVNITLKEYVRAFEICKSVFGILKEKPDKLKLSKTFYLYGLALKEQKHYSRALIYFQQSIDADPAFALCLLEIAKSSYFIKDYNQTLKALENLIKLDPKNSEAYYLKGVTLNDILFSSNLKAPENNEKFISQIYECYQNAIENDPKLAVAYAKMSLLKRRQNDDIKALSYIDKALEIGPVQANYYFLKSQIHLNLFEIDTSIEAAKKAIDLSPNYALAWNILGYAYSFKAEYEKSLIYVEKCIALNRNIAVSHLNRGILLLRDGKLEEGFREYEWRLDSEELSLNPILKVRTWNGEPLDNKVLFLFLEQGLGDFVFIARYLKLILQLYPKAQVYCQINDSLKSFLNDNFGNRIGFLVDGDKVPHYDYLASLLSLPCVFKTQLSTIPFSEGYLKANSSLVKQWNSVIENVEKPNAQPKIGVVWAGNPNHRNDKARSLKLTYFSKLLKNHKCTFYSLQVEISPSNLEVLQKNNIIDLGSKIKDFSDTAAIIENLDIIISIDTAVVHLAGALSKPVWVLLPYAADWRWFNDREDSPWYKSVKLFRQIQYQDWNSVLKAIDNQLKALVKNFKK